MDKNRVYYIWNENLINECDRIPVILQRASLVHNLIVAYGLTNRLTVVKSKSATYEDLKEFHSELYLDHLKTFKDLDEDYIPNDQDEEFGIGYDCPPISNMYEMVCTIAGGSVTAVRSLTLGCADIAINWCGGWHHAQRFAADGFCYINDIVIAIEKLRRRFPKVLYTDLDAHHGNGVEDAYNLSKTVFTLSFHKHETGYYPSSGAINDIGSLIGKGFACNFPFKQGYTDETLIYAFDNVFPMICDEFAPDAIVVQCGADALARDPHGGGALTCSGYVHCVRSVLDRRKPTLLLGGGGYNFPNVARLWTNLTALVLGLTLDEDIPEHEFYERYGPDYTLKIDKSLCRDENNDAHLEGCIDIIRDNLERYLIKKQKHVDGPPTKKLKTEENSI